MLTPKELKDLKNQMRRMDRSPKEWARQMAEMDPLAAAQLATSLLKDINHELRMVENKLQEEKDLEIESQLETDEISRTATQDVMKRMRNPPQRAES